MELKTILLALMASVVSATPTNDTISSGDFEIPYCADLTFPTNGSFQEANCVIKPENVAIFQFAISQIEITSEDPILTRRGGSTLKTPLVPENGRLLWKEDGDTNANTFKQCINNGPRPNTGDVQKLCAKVDNSYVIRRAGQPSADPKAGPCVCKVWSYNSAVFSVCNCDSCDALVIPSGLRDMCREISEHCTTQGYSSGYMKMPDASALYEQHMAGKGEKKNVKLEMGDLSEELTLTCRSGNTTKTGQDMTGKYIKCERTGVTKKCWRTTDPKSVWWEW